MATQTNAANRMKIKHVVNYKFSNVVTSILKLYYVDCKQFRILSWNFWRNYLNNITFLKFFCRCLAFLLVFLLVHLLTVDVLSNVPSDVTIAGTQSRAAHFPHHFLKILIVNFCNDFPFLIKKNISFRSIPHRLENQTPHFPVHLLGILEKKDGCS